MTSYKLNEAKMFADVTDNIAIIINGESGIYYGMNNFSTSVFENLIKGVSAENVLNELQKIPDVALDIEIKFNAFVRAMVEKELLIPSDEENDMMPQINVAAAAQDGFSLNVSEYNDAQELLLADPIHEVKEETGWSPEKTALNPDAEDVARREAKMSE